MAPSTYPDNNGKEPTKTNGILPVNNYDRQSIVHVYNLITKDPTRKFTTEALALAVGINRNKLHYGFKQVYGTTIHALQIALRMKKAQTLLATTQQPLKTIATTVGYSNSSDFGYAFKKRFGLTPTAYRKQASTTYMESNDHEAA
ncbi:helix-turn-helix transcriptional regulator [Niastella caeni]|uniref:Helix-turn-helix transcriptional regulator n=1 Tax=Niastella caeni TaxID=2569763 RepID=A0A4S8HVA6_9BACT|nr:AraC family transcriptional regulator [Niastella caeni]THU39598.1 helix-turn-helix transcriptional regulator [Niastella caeni]